MQTVKTKIREKEYLTISRKEFIQNKNENDIQYVNRIFNIYEKCTHWIAKETLSEYGIKENRVYEFFREKLSEEFVIINDRKSLSLIWLNAKGNLAIEVI